MEPNITKFLNDKKETYLKNKIKANLSEENANKIRMEADSKFSLKEWLRDSSHRAQQLSYTTHPAKFSHPDAKINHFIAEREQRDDGLLRSGNAGAIPDVVGNAACLDVHKFLSVKLNNGLSIMENLVQETKMIQALIESTGLDYQGIREAYLKVQQNNEIKQSSTKLKQVYFPVTSSTAAENDYHLLSLLTSSSMLYELKKHISETDFSEQNKQARKRRNDDKDKKDAEFSEQINEIRNRTYIGFGGSQPQNISYTNSKYRRVAFLLNSMPPVIAKRKTNPPKEDFYQNTLWLNEEFKALFDKLNNAVHMPIGRSKIDRMRDGIIREIFYHIHLKAKEVRRKGAGWSNFPTYKNLPQWQKIYLDYANAKLRKDEKKNENYQQNCIEYSAKWITRQYSDRFKENLGDDEVKNIAKVLTQMQDILL